MINEPKTWYERVEDKRAPDLVIGRPAYMLRWWLIPRNRFFNIYLHKFLASDDDEALHDHPWVNISIILKGSYIEHTIAAGGVKCAKLYKTGDFKMRRAKSAHYIEINEPCWSLFITGPQIRTWGFHCPNGWKSWRDFLGQKHGNMADGVKREGFGCGE